MVPQLSVVTAIRVVRHVASPIGKMNTTRKEFLLAPIKKIDTFVLPQLS